MLDIGAGLYNGVYDFQKAESRSGDCSSIMYVCMKAGIKASGQGLDTVGTPFTTNFVVHYQLPELFSIAADNHGIQDYYPDHWSVKQALSTGTRRRPLF